ncbi:Cmx/CmrA family chloramphenicol efflux MFS transporter [Aeromicrobium chenweiae]|uniref:MFS transporter n=1 Tax=Aeromicrobium chenweiae TaxID=2079793 RepID=A0A2S0WIB6_9ACTN|nr:Cmx/CmrA family chloramphenicol efflux MFS transporter [Aeromicrobium chenweiae]AWB91024.1 MFS transporter [Aeromicrobium chenweiae]TGN31928.1 MFS transporter [Aeromicrobium chenweiae]
MTRTRKAEETVGSVRLPAVVWLVSLGIFLLGTSEFMLAGLLPQMAADLDVGLPQAGLLVSAFALGMVVGAPTMTVVTMRLPRRTTLVVALVVFAISHVIAAVTSDFPLLLVVRVTAAFATGAYWAVGAVVVTQAVPRTHQAKALGVLVGGLTVANVAGVPLGSYAGSQLGWRGPFWALAGLSLALAVAVSLQVPQQSEKTSPSLGDEVRALRRPRLWAVYATAAFAQGAVFAAFNYVSPLLTERSGLPEAVVPAVLIGFGIGAFVGTVLGGQFGDARPTATPLTAITVTVAVLALLGFGPGTPWLVVPLVVVLGTSAFVVAPVLTSQALHLAGQAPTLASSLSVSAFNVGNMIGPLLGGLALSTGLGVRGPAVAGTALAAAALAIVAATALSRRGAAEDTGAR